MAPVIAAVALVAAVQAALVLFEVVTITTALVAVAVTAVSAGAAYAMRPDPPGAPAVSGQAASAVTGGRSIPTRQPIAPRRFVYGACRVGGNLFFLDNANPYLLIGSALSDGVIQSIDGVQIGSTNVPLNTDGTAKSGTIFYQKLALEKGLGLSTQTTSTLLSASFPDVATDTFRQRGVARAVAKLDWGADIEEHNKLWAGGVVPVYSIKGVKVYDPRDSTQSASNPATWKYSTNPALCAAHAITNAWGIAVSTTDLDYESVMSAANTCDTLITIEGESFKMFELAGVVQSDVNMGSQFAAMLSVFGGDILFDEGKYKIVADKARNSVFTITEDDIMEIQSYRAEPDRSTFFNAIKARYFDADFGGERLTTPVYEVPGAVAVEGLRETAIDLPFSATSHGAQIMAYRTLLRFRAGKACAVKITDIGAFFLPYDVITIASTAMPFLNDTYEIVQVDMDSTGVILSLRVYVPEAYNDYSSFVQSFAPQGY